MESEKSENDRELTSTMGNVLSGSSKHEKNDTNDATPTSSTDANTKATCSHAVSEDPISSTSSEIEQSQKTVTNVTTMEADNTVSLETDADLLEISMMAHSSSEKITENVDDLVQDLETLLGESTDSFNIPTKSRPTPTEEPAKVPETLHAELEENEETEEKTFQNEDQSKENSEETPQSVSVSDNVTNEREKKDHEAERAQETSILIETSTDFEEKHEEEAKSAPEVCEIGVVSGVFEENEPEIVDKKEEEKIEENVVLEENEEKEEPDGSSVDEIVNKFEENLDSGDVVDNTQNIQETKEDILQNINTSSEITNNESKTPLTVIEQSPDSASAQEKDKNGLEETNSQVSSIFEEQKSTKEEEEVTVQHEVGSQPKIVDNAIEENTNIHTPEQIAIEEEEENKIEAAEQCEEKKEVAMDEMKNEEEPQVLEPENEISMVSEQKEEENVKKETTDAILNTITPLPVAEIEETTSNEETITDKIIPDETLQEEEKEEEKTPKEDDVNQITATEEPIQDIPPSSDDKVAIEENEEQLKITEVPIDEDSIVVEEKEDTLDHKEISEENEQSLDQVKDIERPREEITTLVDNKIECEEKEESVVPAEIVEEPMEEDRIAVEDKEDNLVQKEIIEKTEEESSLPIEENEDQLNQADLVVVAPIEDITKSEENNAVVNDEEISSNQVELKQTTPEESLEQISTVESSQKSEDLFEIQRTTEEPVTVEEIASQNEGNEEKTTDVKFKIGDAVLLDEEEENVEQKDVEHSVEENVEKETKSLVVATATEETLTPIEDVLTETAPVVESEENFETMLAVASLQQDSIAEANEKPYSEKEIREMEALRMAVESITQNTVEPLLGNTAKEPKVENVPPKTSILEQQLKREEVYQKYRIEKPLSVSVDEPFTEKEKPYSPKITIKPIKAPSEEVSTTSDNEAKGPLKMTITKQSDNTHSILKVYNPEEDHQEGHGHEQIGEEPIPKLRIKPQNAKMSTRSSKQTYSPTSSSLSPRITIKPVVKPESPFKITIKPESTKKSSPKIVTEQAVSPRITIKPIPKPSEESASPPTTPKLTIKPIKRHADDDVEAERSSPKITIKPLVKPGESETGPRLTIKPIKKQDDLEKSECELSPKVSIKTVIKPHESTFSQQNELEEEVKERIVLKINKGNLPTPSKESKKREHPPDEDKSEKLAKIKVKLSKEGGHARIVQETDDHTKRPRRDNGNPSDDIIHKRSKKDVHHYSTDEAAKRVFEEKQLTERAKKMRVDDAYEPRLRQLSGETSEEGSIDAESKIAMPIVITDDPRTPHGSECVLVEDSMDVMGGAQSCGATPSPGGQIVTTPTSTPTPRRRGRPRKVPLEVREEFKDPDPESLTSELPKEAMATGPQQTGATSGRPKRSCRGQNVMATLGIKPRKPRGGGRGRGGKANMGTRTAPMKPEKEPKLSKARLKLLEKAAKDDLKTVHDVPFALFNTDDKPNDGLTGYFERKSDIKASRFEDTLDSVIRDVLSRPDAVTSDIVMVDEETRMSAETSSRAQTPAKQAIPPVDVIEESQSSGTTESGKASVSRPNKAPRLEVHQEPEGNVLSADQLAEYCWNGNGPFMLQEQVAQFLGIKSFKRKYPGMTRRTVEMQERDFIRESGLASEAMCDLGLTAVNSADVLDIMYSDFQEKYEEYCKHQRDRQAKDLINKQRALTLAASQEKTKIDITEQAVQSAAQWNAGFNKARQEDRKACMDLQSLTVHYPKGNLKQLTKPKIGNYPVALVPGQFTDYYQEYTPTEINNLPLNTMCYDAVKLMPPEESCGESEEGSESDSDSSTTSSDSSRSSSSLEDCKLCKTTPKKVLAK